VDGQTASVPKVTDSRAFAAPRVAADPPVRAGIGPADGGHLRLTHPGEREDRIVLNFQAARLMHRHDEEWVEMSPVADHSADSHDPERRLVHGAQVYRCPGCDEEIQFEPREVAE
jgi:hypothetical protein